MNNSHIDGSDQNGRSMKGLALFVIVGLVACSVLVMPLILQRREKARRQMCESKLETIVSGLIGFHEANGSFPPAYLFDPGQEEKWHSWRALIAPIVGNENIYSEYDLAKPWDDTVNQPLVAQVPPYMKCPAHLKRQQGETSYSAVTGTGTIFEGSKSLNADQIGDGTEFTLITGEVAELKIGWTEPKDVDIDQSPGLGKSDGFQSEHGSGANFATAAGSVRFYSTKMEPALFRSLCLHSDSPAAEAAPTGEKAAKPTGEAP